MKVQTQAGRHEGRHVGRHEGRHLGRHKGRVILKIIYRTRGPFAALLSLVKAII